MGDSDDLTKAFIEKKKAKAATITGQQVIDEATKYLGEPYQWGSKKPSIVDNDGFDCSGYVSWVLKSLGLKPPEGSYNQFDWCRAAKLCIPLERARYTEGALVFRRDKITKKICHVGFTDGEGNTLEANGKKLGTLSMKWRNSWTDAGLIPGVDYTKKEIGK